MLKFPHEFQLDKKDCGPTCIKIIAKYYGQSVSLQYLKELSSVTMEGISLFDIGRACEHIGLRTVCFKLDFEALQKIPLPAIVHWNNNHFIVVYKIKNNQVYVSDPGKGLLKYHIKTFTKGWLGNNTKWAVVALEPMADFNYKS